MVYTRAEDGPCRVGGRRTLLVLLLPALALLLAPVLSAVSGLSGQAAASPEPEAAADSGAMPHMSAEEALAWVQDKDLAFVYFWDPNCRYCQMADPVLEELVTEMALQMAVVDVSISDNRWLPVQLETTATPTIWTFVGAKLLRPPLVGFLGEARYREAFELIVDFAEDYDAEEPES